MQWALAEGKAAEIVGHGSKRAIGRPAQTDLTLDLSALSGVTLYEPEELVLSAKAGTPLAEIEALVAAKGQQLAFEPMDYATLLGGVAGRGTIGGALAANLAGPRRIKAGAARDHFLGFSAVSGRGETFKSGGRVVKNVTGYDLCKLIAGSWGTLAAMTEVTIKVLPRPETEETLLIRGLEPAQAVEAMTTAMGSSCDVSGAAHLPAEVATSHPGGRGAGAGVTALRLEGFSPSVAHRRGVLAGADETVRRSRDHRCAGLARVLAGGARRHAVCGRPRAAWSGRSGGSRRRQTAAPSSARRSRAGAGRRCSTIGPVASSGLRSPRPTMPARRRSAPLSPRPAAMRRSSARRLRCARRSTYSSRRMRRLAALTKRVKESFDPKGVLNPGRMWAGV